MLSACALEKLSALLGVILYEATMNNVSEKAEPLTLTQSWSSKESSHNTCAVQLLNPTISCTTRFIWNVSRLLVKKLSAGFLPKTKTKHQIFVERTKSTKFEILHGLFSYPDYEEQINSVSRVKALLKLQRLCNALTCLLSSPTLSWIQTSAQTKPIHSFEGDRRQTYVISPIIYRILASCSVLMFIFWQIRGHHLHFYN